MSPVVQHRRQLPEEASNKSPSCSSYTNKVAIYKSSAAPLLQADRNVRHHHNNDHHHNDIRDNVVDDPKFHYSREESNSSMFTYQEDCSWDDFCEELPMEES